LYERYKRLKREDNPPRVNEPILKSVNRNQSRYRSDFNKVTKKRVIEGVIWSEILGPPRSKRPHSSQGQYSRNTK
ncbi:unnamed protein product, partial [Chrysoparadoxa australica]